MKTIRAVFHNGHLWNPDTKTRVVFRNKSEVVITVSGDEALNETDPNNEPPATLQSELEQAAAMEARQLLEQSKMKFFEYRKIMSRGSSLYFKISAGIRDKEKSERMQTFFKVVLLEDLYIVRTKISDKEGRVEPCVCVVESESGYNLPYFEPVFAYSLNDAYSKTFVLYFNIFGKATANVYDRFYTRPTHSSDYQLKRLRTFSE